VKGRYKASVVHWIGEYIQRIQSYNEQIISMNLLKTAGFSNQAMVLFWVKDYIDQVRRLLSYHSFKFLAFRID